MVWEQDLRFATCIREEVCPPDDIVAKPLVLGIIDGLCLKSMCLSVIPGFQENVIRTY